MALLFVLLAWAAPARAQIGGLFGPQQGGFEGGITRKGVNAYAKILGLDEAQKEVAKTLMEANRAALKDLQKDLEAKTNALQEKARDSGDWQSMTKEMPAIIRDMMAKTKKIEKSYFEDLKATLTPEQEAKFDAVERHRRREMWLRWGLRSGQGVDLIDAIEKSKIDLKANKDLAEALNTYEEGMDKALKPVEGAMDESMEKMFDKMAKMDFMAMGDAFTSMDDHAKKIRDFNRDSARRILPLIPEKQRDAVEMEINRRSFPRIYKESHASKSIAAALKIADLSGEQKDSLKSLQESYTREAATLNEKWAAAQEAKEEKKGGKIKMAMTMWQDAGEQDDATKAKKEREELDKKTLERLNTVLKEEQRGQLPAEKKGSGNPMIEEFMPGFEEEAEEH